jgi:hypothetical protein
MMKCLRRHIDETCATWALLLFILLLRKVLTDLSAAPKSRAVRRSKLNLYKFAQMMRPGYAIQSRREVREQLGTGD